MLTLQSKDISLETHPFYQLRAYTEGEGAYSNAYVLINDARCAFQEIARVARQFGPTGQNPAPTGAALDRLHACAFDNCHHSGIESLIGEAEDELKTLIARARDRYAQVVVQWVKKFLENGFYFPDKESAFRYAEQAICDAAGMGCRCKADLSSLHDELSGYKLDADLP